MRTLAAKAVALTAVCTIAGLAAANAAIYVKFEGVDGEASDADHKDWIIISSLRLAEADQALRGGVNVSTGDIDGHGADPAPESPGAATGGGGGAGKVKMGSARKPAPQPSPERGVAARGDPVPIGLLLPAVQKVRVATAPVPAWPGCAAGQRLGTVSLRDTDRDRTGRILDATVTECAREHVSFNFTKVEWD